MSERVAEGRLAQGGLLDDAACDAAEAVLAQVATSGVETVRVLFSDQHGVLRGKALTREALPSVFANGLPVASTLLLKDTSARTAFPVWTEDAGIGAGLLQGAGDVVLVPDPASFRILPWAPHSAWLLCDVAYRDGRPVPFTSRAVLRQAVAQLEQAGMAATIGLEIEFHVFERVDGSLDHNQTSMPGQPPRTRALAHGYQFLTEALYAQAEPVLDALRRAAEGLGLPVRSVEVEMGPSQFEFTFGPAAPEACADMLVMFRAMAKQVCAARGLHASFMARPRLDNVAACGWHIHQSVSDIETGRNLFMPGADAALGPAAGGWIAGLLAHARAASLLTVPTVNGYKRYGPYQLAPDRIAWGADNRGAMVRAITAPGDRASRIENRAPESAANPHFAIAAQLVCGLDGIRRGLKAPPPTLAPYDDTAERLPASLGEAIDAFDRSDLMRGALGKETVDYLVRIKRFEWDRYLSALSEWEQAEYFSLF